MKIDWKKRIENPWFWISFAGVVFSPVLAAMGISQTDLTSWNSVLNVLNTFVSTPYLVFAAIGAGLGFLGISADLSSKGLSDQENQN